ncbi:hypothetical protein ED857_19545 [Acinetobacter baumannii]|nr:hypothetical protein [Acinetobacter baumannii]RND08286.1 hypothetical protein ED857_19545 [Acinetobacter baumannii]
MNVPAPITEKEADMIGLASMQATYARPSMQLLGAEQKGAAKLRARPHQILQKLTKPLNGPACGC